MVAAALLTATTGPASATGTAAPEPDVDDIVVTAQPGPPIWHVLHGQSDIVIVGTVAPLPQSFHWSPARLTAGLVGARRILIGPEPSSGLVWNDNFTGDKIRTLRLPAGQTIRTALTAPTLLRYDDALAMGKLPARDFDRWNPGIVGFVVLDHGRRALGLTTAEPATTIRRIAGQNHVHASYVVPRAGLPTLDQLPRLTVQQQVRCLEQSLDNLDRERSNASEIAKAWSVGDVSYLRESYEPPHACEDLLAGDSGVRLSAVDDMLTEITHDLALPGRTVALIDVALLLRSDLLAKLSAWGAEIRPPKGG